MKYSEKRTYILNNELLYITKCRKDKDDDSIYNVTYENLVTKEVKTVKHTELDDAIKTVDSTEFFVMWMHFNNFRREDNTEDGHKYVLDHCEKVLNTLSTNKIEMHGSNKFEKYDLDHIAEMYNYYHHDNFQTHPVQEIETIIEHYDGLYTYHLIYTDEEREHFDKVHEFSDILKEEITLELNREIMKQFKIEDPFILEVLRDYAKELDENDS